MIKSMFQKSAMAVVLTAIFFQCTPDAKDIKGETKHYDIVAVLNSEIQKLNSHNPKLIKTVKFQTDSNVIETNDVDWEKELGMFYAMDINKPALASLFDSVFNESLIYRQKEDSHKVNVKELKIKFSESDFPLMISATIVENNYLYASDKKMLLTFDPESKRLVQYRIKSKTKVILKGEESGEIIADIIY